MSAETYPKIKRDYDFTIVGANEKTILLKAAASGCSVLVPPLFWLYSAAGSIAPAFASTVTAHDLTHCPLCISARSFSLRRGSSTLLLLSNFRNILWQTDSELDIIAAELNLPLQKLDAVLSRIDAEIGMENRRLELRLERLAKTRQLLDRINDALTSLKYKPDNGPLLYDLIYLSEEKLHQTDILYRLNISRRHYYRLKEQAISIISLRLWSVPSTNIDLWLDLVSMLSDKSTSSGR